MNEKLQKHIDELFKNAPVTRQTVEIKEEILQNTQDRYNDLLAEGKSEESAYNIAVAGIGDVEHLIDSMIAPMSSSGYTKEEIRKNQSRRSLLLAVSIALYILCVVPVIICDELGINEVVGIVLMFVLAAVATAMIIYRSGMKLEYNVSDETVVEEFKKWNRESKENSSMLGAVNGAVWALTLTAYFVTSFLTGAWYITWLIFIIGGAVSGIVKAVFDLRK